MLKCDATAKPLEQNRQLRSFRGASRWRPPVWRVPVREIRLFPGGAADPVRTHCGIPTGFLSSTTPASCCACVRRALPKGGQRENANILYEFTKLPRVGGKLFDNAVNFVRFSARLPHFRNDHVAVNVFVCSGISFHPNQTVFFAVIQPVTRPSGSDDAL